MNASSVRSPKLDLLVSAMRKATHADTAPQRYAARRAYLLSWVETVLHAGLTDDQKLVKVRDALAAFDVLESQDRSS